MKIPLCCEIEFTEKSQISDRRPSNPILRYLMPDSLKQVANHEIRPRGRYLERPSASLSASFG